MTTRLRWIGGVGLVLAGWLLVLFAMPFFGPGGRTVAVTGETVAAINAVREAGGRIVSVRNGIVLARGEGGFALRLYRAGAPLVLEGRIAAGCFS